MSAVNTQTPGGTGWDHPRTPWYYEQFSQRHDRYREANRVLAEHAALAPGQRVLDLAAGTGRTAEAALPLIGPQGSILCVEPAGAMRDTGRRRLSDHRVAWASDWPHDRERFDRILCGAAIWQITPLADTFARLAGLLGHGGALCFNIPSLYLGEADDPGGGSDPLLLQLPTLLLPAPSPADVCQDTPLSAAEIDRLLTQAGFRSERWGSRMRFTQTAYRDWLKIPVLTDRLLPGLGPDERALRIDRAFAQVDSSSWRWERWTGWTAWAV